MAILAGKQPWTETLLTNLLLTCMPVGRCILHNHQVSPTLSSKGSVTQKSSLNSPPLGKVGCRKRHFFLDVSRKVWKALVLSMVYEAQRKGLIGWGGGSAEEPLLSMLNFRLKYLLIKDLSRSSFH